MVVVQDGPYNVKSIEANLQSHVDWMKRIQALQVIQEWAKSEKVHSSPAFVSGIHQLRDLIADQVADIRSSVSKEASLTISVLANTMKDAAFHSHVEVFLTTLLKALVVTIEVIAQAADACLQSVLKSSRIGHFAAVPKLVEAFGSRNAVLRRHTIEYFTLICNTWNPKSMLRHGFPHALTKVLLQGLCDASGDVRLQSRKCFWAFHAVHPKKALLVYEKVDSATKHKLHEEGGRPPLVADPSVPKDGPLLPPVLPPLHISSGASIVAQERTSFATIRGRPSLDAATHMERAASFCTIRARPSLDRANTTVGFSSSSSRESFVSTCTTQTAPPMRRTKSAALSRSASLEASEAVHPVVARLYQPDYFQNRWQRLAKLKEARESRECPFMPAIRKTRQKPFHQPIPMLALDGVAFQSNIRGCVSPTNA
ncbi:Aste57867_20188 [Aphanomyces stellatus]|uniref:Aste57867_20188 protein n=1 Tax=Aphanomyces stellatus TaxID=120398 RepID=A0A485LF41_9STRA|nr:hypothetical protein As57867_020122 [Aphanomyces stellatus]VFT96882.1 Aste57867_20188 [Aphanomyces stellatus]